MMNDILNAIKSHRIIKIGYRSKTGNSSVRLIEPYEIKDNKLYGYCLEKKSIRAFIVNNINSVEVTDKYFNPRW